MKHADEHSMNESQPAGIGPGERLQAARIQKGLSLEDVASRMHLSVAILKAIEENNFEEVTAPIFVKGYLRAYARIVDLNEDELIEQYAQYYSEEDPPISSISNTTPELSVTDMRIKWTTYLVVVVLAVLLTAWWWNKEKNQDAPISLDSQGQRLDSTDYAGDDSVTSSIEAVSESSVEPAAPAVSTELEAEPAMSTELEAEPAMVEPEPASEPIAVETEMQAVDPETQPAEVETEPAGTLPGAETESSTVAIIEANPIAPTGSDKLQIIVHADTWADIKDDNNYQLVYDLLRANESLELTGTAPFAVFLGNGHGVEIRFNGEDIEFFYRIRDDNTARLKIGG